jgi:hypothetical protein
VAAVSIFLLIAVLLSTLTAVKRRTLEDVTVPTTALARVSMP